MTLIDDWKCVWHRLWSVRLSLLAAVASAGEAAFQYWATGKPAWIALSAAAISLGASVARVVAQTSLSEENGS